jgi:hypothetical protein
MPRFIPIRTKNPHRRCYFASGSYFIVLRENQTGSIVAFMSCFACGSCLLNKHVGFDYSKPKSWMLYFRLWDAAVDWALSQGFGSIHSGQTTYQAKIEMGHDLVPLINYIWHRNVLLHSVYGRVVQNLDWAKLDDDLALFVRAYPSAARICQPLPENCQDIPHFSLPARLIRALPPVRPWRKDREEKPGLRSY